MSLSFFLTFFYSQFLVTPSYPTHDFSGQIVIVTGANVGLGFEAARHLTRLNAAKVILAVRTTSKGEAAKASIEKSNPNRKGVVEVWPLDLGSYESVKAFAQRANNELPRLDVLLENAGVSLKEFKIVEQDETTITTNVVSTFLLALLLLPKLRETTVKHNVEPRLVIVSSEVHHNTELPEKANPSIFDALNDKDSKMLNGFLPMRYFTSKLLEVLYVHKLAPALTSSQASGKPPVILNMLNPGFCISNLAGNDDGPPPFLKYVIIPLIARKTEVGSRTLVAAAAAGQETHGRYMSDGIVAEEAAWTKSEDGQATAQRVWDELNAKLEKIVPGVTKNI